MPASVSTFTNSQFFPAPGSTKKVRTWVIFMIVCLPKPAFNLQARNSREMPDIAGDQCEPLFKSDGGDAKVGLGQGRPPAYQLVPQAAVDYRSLVIKGQDSEVGPDFVVQPLQVMLCTWAPQSAVDHLTYGDA